MFELQGRSRIWFDVQVFLVFNSFWGSTNTDVDGCDAVLRSPRRLKLVARAILSRPMLASTTLDMTAKSHPSPETEATLSKIQKD